MHKIIILIILLISLLDAKSITIYVNSHLGNEATITRWQPTIKLLNKEIPKHTFSLLPIKPTQVKKIKKLIQNKKIDFILTQPAITTELEYTLGITKLLTMSNSFGMNKFGSVFITKINKKIKTIQDIKGKSIAAVAPLGFGGWLIAYNELYDYGIDPIKDEKVTFLGNQKKVIQNIQNGLNEVGVIRTGMIETLSNEIDISNLQIINNKQKHHPIILSTKLFPEWSFSKAKHIDNNIANEVFKVLTNIKEEDKEAIIGKYKAWNLPESHQEVDELFKRFRLGHYADLPLYSEKTLFKVLIASFIIIVLISILINYLTVKRLNRKLREKVNDKTKRLDNLIDRFKFASNNALNGYWEWNIKTNEIYFSSGWFSVLGYKKSDFPDITAQDVMQNLMHKDDFPRVQKTINDFLENKLEKYDVEFRLKHKNGEYIWIKALGSILNDSFFGFHLDINNKVKSQEELNRQKMEFETIFNYSQDGIAILDINSNFLKSNSAFQDITGYSKEELLKTSCINLTIPQDKIRTKKAFEYVKKNYSLKNFEKSCHTKDGVIKNVNLSISLLPDGKSYLMLAKDISAQKILEEQSRLASMGEMIGNIAHQWRQPLSIISTSASGIRMKYIYDELNENDIDEFSNTIIKQSEYLSNTIDNFRDFIKNEKIYTKTSIKESIETSLSLVNASLSNNYINLIVDIDDDLFIQGNKNELSEAFINILNNSKDVLKSNIENEDDRLIFIKTKKLNSSSLNLEIYDTGEGINENILNRIFEPYFTTKHQYEGTGLGLAIVDKILRLRHKTKIDVYNKEFQYKSKTYKGACFSITFINS